MMFHAVLLYPYIYKYIQLKSAKVLIWEEIKYLQIQYIFDDILHPIETYMADILAPSLCLQLCLIVPEAVSVSGKGEHKIKCQEHNDPTPHQNQAKPISILWSVSRWRLKSQS